jgi:hypothetical protein
MELAERLFFIVEGDNNADVRPPLLVLLISIGLTLRLLVLLLRLAWLPLLPRVLLPRLLLLPWLLLAAGLLRGLLGNRLWRRFLLGRFVLVFGLDHARRLNIHINVSIYSLKINALRIPVILVIFGLLGDDP